MSGGKGGKGGNPESLGDRALFAAGAKRRKPAETLYGYSVLSS